MSASPHNRCRILKCIHLTVKPSHQTENNIVIINLNYFFPLGFVILRHMRLTSAHLAPRVSPGGVNCEGCSLDTGCAYAMLLLHSCTPSRRCWTWPCWKSNRLAWHRPGAHVRKPAQGSLKIMCASQLCPHHSAPLSLWPWRQAYAKTSEYSGKSATRGVNVGTPTETGNKKKVIQILSSVTKVQAGGVRRGPGCASSLEFCPSHPNGSSAPTCLLAPFTQYSGLSALG